MIVYVCILYIYIFLFITKLGFRTCSFFPLMAYRLKSKDHLKPQQPLNSDTLGDIC